MVLLYHIPIYMMVSLHHSLNILSGGSPAPHPYLGGGFLAPWTENILSGGSPAPHFYLCDGFLAP
jgi:hypothetical protein